MNKFLSLFALLSAAFCTASAPAATVITFEDLPDAYFFNSGGQNIGTYYVGLDFEPYVTGLSVSRFGGYDNTAFPTHSGDVAIWDAFDDDMTVSFEMPQDDVGFWYTSLGQITLTALDAGGNVLGSATGNANTDGTTGSSDFLSISENNIASIDVGGVGLAGQYVLDDLTFSSAAPLTATPEPASWSLLAIAALFILAVPLRKRLRSVLCRSPHDSVIVPAEDRNGC